MTAILKLEVDDDGTVTMEFKGKRYKKKVTDVSNLGLVLFNTTMSIALIPGTLRAERTTLWSFSAVTSRVVRCGAIPSSAWSSILVLGSENDSACTTATCPSRAFADSAARNASRRAWRGIPSEKSRG